MARETFNPSIAEDLGDLGFDQIVGARPQRAPSAASQPARDKTSTETATRRRKSAAPERPATQVHETSPGPAKVSESVGVTQIGPDLAEEVEEAVRAAHGLLREGGRPGLSFGEMALLAVRENRGQLATMWTVADGSDADEDELFPGLDSRVHRPRPGKRVRLYMSFRSEHLQQLDNLVEKWQAPSRSALIDEAFRLKYCSDADGERADV